MKKQRVRIAAGLALATLLTSMLPADTAAAAPSESDELKGMKQAAENDSLILYVDEEETDVAVYVKETGDVWFSNPVDGEEDSVASDYNIRLLKSQIFLRYFNENVQESSMDNYSDCIREGQFETEYFDDGVTFTYNIGDTGDKILLPQVISIERLEGYAAQLESSESKKLLRNYTKLDPETMSEEDLKTNTETYPGLEKHGIYVLRSSTKDYIREQLAEYLAGVGYTAEDFAFDLEDNGFQSENNKPWFKVPLTYRLDGESLVVEVDPAQIEYNTEYYLVDVELLPYFGAAGTDEDGYLFVPDGSGALINFNNKKQTNYSAAVYGQDAAMDALRTSRSEIEQSLTVKMPVYGLKSGDKAWYAVIEDGDAYADISASVSGRTNSYNSIYAGFQYLSYGACSLGSMVGSNSFQMYSPASFEGSYRIRYSFLHGEQADYSGMAQGYREYLINRGVLAERTTEKSLPFYAEYIGAIDKYAIFLGIKYRSITPVTTYGQAEEITEKLLEAGIDNVNVIYSGWANGGLHNKAYTSINAVKQLEKGGTSQKEFLRDMEERQVDTFLTAQLQYVYRDTLFDGYSPLSNGPKYFDRSTVKQAAYFRANNVVDKSNSIDLISPRYASRVSAELKKRLGSKGNIGLNLGTICYNLYSDQWEESYTDRQAAKQYNTETMAELSESFGGRLMGDNANSYAWGQISDIINVPFDSNRGLIIDEVVPFYEMVLHGYINYAGDCMNMSDDYNTSLLKSVESGAGLYFKWIYEDNSVVKETDYDDLYSVNYSAWMEKAKEDYQKLNEVLGVLQGETIVKHEIISKGLVRVTYEKGTQILVNYSDQDSVVDGCSVKAGSYAVVNGHE